MRNTNIKHKKLILIFLIFLLLICPGLLLAQNTLTGKVLSGQTPVSSASVFLNSTLVGTSTNSDGTFTLSNVKNGNYDIVVMCVGYETYSKKINVYNADIKLADIKLAPKTDSLAEVKIVAKRHESNLERMGYIHLFEREFFGYSSNASDCKLLNPELLDFTFNKDIDRLSATSNGYLILENKALGYRIKYLLQSFVFDPSQKQLAYTGLYKFEEMSGTPEQQKTWQAKRMLTYSRSEMHFLRSCIAGDLDEHKFTVRKLIRKLNENRQPDSIIYANLKRYRLPGMGSNSYQASLRYWEEENAKKRYDQQLFDRLLNIDEFIKTTDIKGIYAFGHTDCLVVSYDNAKSTSLKVISVITFKEPYTYFDSNGVIFTPYNTIVEGFWGTQRIAELLPVDYEEPKN